MRSTRLLAACLVLVGLALVQDPGLLVADTKFDLVTAPGDWLARSLHVWDGEGGFGQVQNQAHGYLWPMGPFFLLGDLSGIPGWVVQRLWQALVMSAALVGTAKLARALGVRSDLACLVAGFAFALSPRLLTSLGPISIEVWPSALVPWVLLPLVRGSEAGSPRRAAALSALAVAMVGGVNAAASFAVVPLAVIWVLTRTPGPRRRALLLWWPVFTALGTLWWVVPLFVMGAYSPPFLDFTETTAVTTFPTTLFDTLRGTEHWVPYVEPDSRAGNELLRTSWLAINSGVLVVLGLVGLLDRRTPHRTFLALSVLAGVLLVTAGHHGAVEGWFAGPVADALDGALGPLRNVHKFDPVVRLPLVIGMAFAIDRAIAAWRERDERLEGRAAADRRAERMNSAVLVAAALLAVVGTATPAVAGRVEPHGAMLGVPAYWEQAADFVAGRSDGGTTLLVPGSPSAEYLWGDTNDEPFQWLARSRWGVRNVAMLAEPGHIRMLDGLERRFAEGHGSPGLTAALQRAGVEHLVVRNDLRPSDDVPDPALVHQAIAQSPGIVRVASFGPDVGGVDFERRGTERVVFDGGRREPRPAIEVYAVTTSSWPGASGGEPTLVAAGPEDLADLVDTGVLGEDPVQLAADADPEDGADRPRRVVLTDGLKARERAFARMHDGASPTLTPDDDRHTSGAVRDFVLGANDDDRWSTTARLEGVRAVSASSAGSDADAAGGSDRGKLPFAAVDGAPDTAWRPDVVDAAPWWQVDLDAPRELSGLTITAAADAEPQTLRVVTPHGSSQVVELSPGGTRRVELPSAESGETGTSWIRVEEASGIAGAELALAEVDVPGVDAHRVLDLPRLPEGWGAPDAVVLRADRDGRTGCVEVDRTTRCAVHGVRSGEDGPALRRAFELDGAQDYGVAATAFPRSGAALDALLLQGQPATVEASSTALADPRAGAVAAIDGDPFTTWLASPADDRVELRIGWLGVRRVSAIRIGLAKATAAARPERVLLRFFRGEEAVEREVDLGRGGRATFEPVRAERVEVRVLSAQQVGDAASAGGVEDVPVGIGEVSLTGLPYLPITLPDDRVRHPCGSGPDVTIGGHLLSTAVTASHAELLSGGEVAAEICRAPDTVPLDAGAVEVVAERSAAFDAGTVVLSATDDPGEPDAVAEAAVDPTGPVERTVRPTPGATVVALRENANAGWVATQDGEELSPVVLDGWQQGFVLEGDGPVVVRYEPDTAYRVGLFGGAAAAVVLLVALVMLARRRPGADLPTAGDRRLPVPLGIAIGLLFSGLVAGTVGLVVGALAIGAVALLRARAPDALPWLLAAPVLVTATAYSVRPWGSPEGWAGSSAWVGYLAVVPLAALAAASAARRSGNTRFRRIAGRSTRR